MAESMGVALAPNQDGSLEQFLIVAGTRFMYHLANVAGTSSGPGWRSSLVEL